MSGGRESWSTQQLAEFLAAVSAFTDEDGAVHEAVERAAETLDAEAGALIDGQTVSASIGFPSGRAPVADLVAVAERRSALLDVPGVGACETICVPVGDDTDSTRRLILARRAGDGFVGEEIHFVRGMARVLALTLRMIRLIENERHLREASERQADENAGLLQSLQGRQSLLERLSAIQRAIARRDDRKQVLDELVEACTQLLGETVGLLLKDEGDAPAVVVFARGPAAERFERARGSLVAGAAARAMAEERLVAIDDADDGAEGVVDLAVDGVRAALAAPVQEQGAIVGALVTASTARGRTYVQSDREILLAFAEAATLALTDAKLVEEANHQAFHDSLTGLPNRALFVDRLAQALSRAERTQSPVGVLFLDLDGFKTVNDSLGHAAGDELLVAVARRLQGCIRAGDTAARFGGDEFAVLVEGLKASENAVAVADKILTELRTPFRLRSRRVSINASVGIATGTSRSEDLLRNADLAMYRAKSHGKRRYETFEPAMHAAMVERLELEADLQRAIERREFMLEYQPIVSLGTGAFVGAEALVRWKHPQRGLVPPSVFIPIAEETGQIPAIGRWVLFEACRHGAKLQATHRPFAISVNLSSAQLQQPSLAGEVEQALRETGLDPASLVLEITETMLMVDTEATIGRLGRLKELGIHLAVDDFGTGYSSLQYLRRFPLDLLKIAKSFVDGLGGPEEESTLARAIIELGDSFQLQVVAEGIERPSQVDRLLELGCRLGQGFYFAKPMDYRAIEYILAERAAEAQRIAS